MNFNSLLIHRCSFLIQGEQMGEDDYGRPISGTIESINIRCRLDQMRERVVADDTGNDYILTNVLFLGSEQSIDLDTKIFNIKDLNGNVVLAGTFIPKDIKPVYGRRNLHHYEVSLLKE